MSDGKVKLFQAPAKLKQTNVALIVDDEKSICETLKGVVTDEGWECLCALSGQEGLELFEKCLPDVVFLDVWMEGIDGIKTLQKMKEINAHVPVVIMSGHGTVDTAVKATKLGAYNFLEKPLSIEKILSMLQYAKSVKLDLRGDFGSFQLIGESKDMVLLHRRINIVAPRNSWVLVTGENGTGKEAVARNIHMLSSRAAQPFIAVNCAAIPDALIESELFGHEKGAFTNAMEPRVGKFELAHKGTLFLDEIGDMSLKTQAKILRILQEQSFERLGSSVSRSIDVRVIAATNKNLSEQIEKKLFRKDLYFRLNVIPIHLPALRDRKDDITILTSSFLRQMAQEMGGGKKVFSSGAQKLLQEYHWPGNVRELKNLVERVCILATTNVITENDMPELKLAIESKEKEIISFELADSTPFKEARVDFEKCFIESRLRKYDWNVSKTADAIGLERSHLHRKIKAYDIETRKLNS